MSESTGASGASFAGQRVCVIGGTAGIGAAIARHAAAQGAAVVVAGRRGEQHQGPAGADARVIDIGDEASIRDFFASLGAIDHLVTTAAFVRPGPFKSGSVEDAQATFTGKFWSQFLCARYAEVRRSILFFSGGYARRAPPGLSAVAAVNGAVESLARALAVEMSPVRVNVISPGLVQGTDAYLRMPDEARRAMIDGAAQRLPAKIVGDADSIAIPALALMASPYATGTVLNIDGGGLLV
jgi:NAD(P)-dependent dehydrogenase (short-subunit alcohol dehydrogenase family)